ncbi:GNAT family N-acetyltransferase [Actinokineospora spheciospongiae]|uniref:GNAT family N-acetyltransferase n=1 Tax=Actinokineospora spheciospongiae TaxID=909613 RepID=UPI000D70AA69|nr:GNAT family N-acetyltransferase [Actinokineospora spheciospongiae]PWW58360.1 putative acetyltransferase [Actinokineospora spheciospongiae]
MRIIVDDLSSPEIAHLLTEHLDDMRAITPLESKHALDLDGLRTPDITFWSVLDANTPVACGAIKRLDTTHAELKSMRTTASHRGRGIAQRLLNHILTESRKMGFTRLSLETGSADFFAPARTLYERAGFTYCEPFADYRPDPHSVFLTRIL